MPCSSSACCVVRRPLARCAATLSPYSVRHFRHWYLPLLPCQRVKKLSNFECRKHSLGRLATFISHKKGRFVIGDKYLYIEHFFLFHSWSGLVERKEITEFFWLTAKCCISRYVQLLSNLLDFSLNLKTICRICDQQWEYVVQCSNLDHFFILLPR